MAQLKPIAVNSKCRHNPFLILEPVFNYKIWRATNDGFALYMTHQDNVTGAYYKIGEMFPNGEFYVQREDAKIWYNIRTNAPLTVTNWSFRHLDSETRNRLRAAIEARNVTETVTILRTGNVCAVSCCGDHSHLFTHGGDLVRYGIL